MDPVSVALAACCVGIPALAALFAFLKGGKSKKEEKVEVAERE